MANKNVKSFHGFEMMLARHFLAVLVLVVCSARQILWRQENELTGESTHYSLLQSEINKQGVTVTSARYHDPANDLPRWVKAMLSWVRSTTSRS